MNRRILTAFVIAFAHFLICAQERVTLLETAIAIQKDGTVHTTETYTIYVTNQSIKHGIYREIPTRYKNDRGMLFDTRLTIDAVQCDGVASPYSVTHKTNGVRMQIGCPNKIVNPGIHRYAITYTEQRLIGFFDTHDELYRNITGADFILPIDQAIVRITLPEKVDAQKITAEAYIGFSGQKGSKSDYITSVASDGTIEVRTARSLKSKEIFTIAVTWPKGIVHEPTTVQKIFWFVRDNVVVMWLLLGVIVVAGYYISRYRRFKQDQHAGTIIPLFEPPAGLSPAQIAYMVNKKYTAQAFSSEIVDLAVRGYLTIEATKKGFFNSRSYVLHKVADAPDDNTLVKLLFASSNDIELSSSSKYFADLLKVRKQIENMTIPLGVANLNFHVDTLFVGILISIGCVAVSPFLMISGMGQEGFIALAILILFFMSVLFWYRMPLYTKEGRQVMDDIEGFKLFLTTTELERFKVIGTPPDKTPQLYERYLPYAMALGVEKEWSSQFTPVFERMAQQAHTYQPRWYQGAFDMRSPDLFAYQLNSLLTNSAATIVSPSSNTISSSGSFPGSSSGSGGRGSAGGGSGGGGMGGW